MTSFVCETVSLKREVLFFGSLCKVNFLTGTKKKDQFHEKRFPITQSKLCSLQDSKKLVKIPHLTYEFIQSLFWSLIWMFGSKIKVGNTEFQMRLRTFLFRSRMPTKVCSNNFLYLLWRQVLTSGRVLLTNRARLEVSSSKLMIRDQPSSSFWTFDQQFREMAASLSSIPPRPNALAEISNKRRSKCIISFFLE